MLVPTRRMDTSMGADPQVRTHTPLRLGEPVGRSSLVAACHLVRPALRRGDCHRLADGGCTLGCVTLVHGLRGCPQMAVDLAVRFLVCGLLRRLVHRCLRGGRLRGGLVGHRRSVDHLLVVGDCERTQQGHEGFVLGIRHRYGHHR